MRPCSLSPACSEGNNMNNVAASTNIKQASRQKPCLIYLCLVPETYTHNILNFSWKASKSRPDLPKLTAEISMICHHSAAHGNRQRCKYIFKTVDRRCVQFIANNVCSLRSRKYEQFFMLTIIISYGSANLLTSLISSKYTFFYVHKLTSFLKINGSIRKDLRSSSIASSLENIVHYRMNAFQRFENRLMTKKFIFFPETCTSKNCLLSHQDPLCALCDSRETVFWSLSSFCRLWQLIISSGRKAPSPKGDRSGRL